MRQPATALAYNAVSVGGAVVTRGRKGPTMLSQPQQRLAGKRAVVTGASRGIGRAIALALAGEGADVAVSARGGAELEALASEIGSLGRRSAAIACDVTDPAQVETLARRAQDALGGADIRVNNPGAAGSHKVLGPPDEPSHQMSGPNLSAVYYFTKAFAPARVARH